MSSDRCTGSMTQLNLNEERERLIDDPCHHKRKPMSSPYQNRKRKKRDIFLIIQGVVLSGALFGVCVLLTLYYTGSQRNRFVPTQYVSEEDYSLPGFTKPLVIYKGPAIGIDCSTDLSTSKHNSTTCNYKNGIPVPPNSSVQRCMDIINTFRDPGAKFLLLSMYDPGNCAEVPNTKIPYFSSLSTLYEQTQMYGGHTVTDLSILCRFKIGAPGDSSWRICYDVPEVLDYAHWMHQMYRYAQHRKQAISELGEKCFNKKLAIYFTPVNTDHPGGPRKVINNLLSGLRLIGKPYTVNARRLKVFDLIFSLDPHHGFFLYYADDSLAKKFYLGPTIASYQFYTRRVTSASRSRAHLVASSNQSLHSGQYFPNLPLEMKNTLIIPTGVDTDMFKPRNIRTNRSYALIYSKDGCNSTNLDETLNELSRQKIPISHLAYGSYGEKGFREQLEKSKFAILCDGDETQGLATGEILSMDVPVLAMSKRSVPYFSPEAGMVMDTSDIRASISNFINAVHAGTFKPRSWVHKNFGLARAAIDTLKALCGLPNPWNPT